MSDVPDLLTHVCSTYAVVTLCSLRIDWLTSPFVTVALVGALLPDLNHVSSLVPGATVERLLGVPFDWNALQTGGVVCLVALLGGTVVDREERPRVLALLSLGAGLHLLLDLLIATPDGRSQSVFWPLSRYQPPTPGLYHSTDLWPLLLAVTLAVVAWGVAWRTRRRDPAVVDEQNA